MSKSATTILLALGGYLAYRWWTSAAATTAPGTITKDTVSPMLAPETVTDKTIDAASQFVTKDLVNWMGGKGVNY